MAGLTMKDVGGVKVYDLSVGRTLPEWISLKQRRSLRKDVEYQRRIELVQDVHFCSASKSIKMSRDGNFIAAVGTYPPTLKMYDVRELSLKFERRFDAGKLPWPQGALRLQARF